jgi:hypothetical protein
MCRGVWKALDRVCKPNPVPSLKLTAAVPVNGSREGIERRTHWAGGTPPRAISLSCTVSSLPLAFEISAIPSSLKGKD